MSYEIYVVSHKDNRMPEGNIYIPVQVGPAKDDFSGFVRDNTGENISEKNPNYCELTAQYWAWKNRKADVKGLVHYRRLFSKGKRMLGASLEKKYENVLDEKWNQGAIINLVNKHGYSFEEAKNLFMNMWLYANGLATLIATNEIKIEEQEILVKLVKFYKILVKGE